MTELYPGGYDAPRHDRYRDDRANIEDASLLAERKSTDTDEPTGFVDTNQDTTLAWDDGTRTLTISPTGATFEYWIKGRLFSSTAVQHTIPDTEGMWHVYFDTDGVLYSTQTFSESLLNTYCYVANLYWDATNSKVVGIGDERHGLMPWQTHELIHDRWGTYAKSGLAIGDILADESGALDTHAQMSIGSGVIKDEDISLTITGLSAPAGIPVIYKDGAAGEWRKATVDTAPLLTTSTGRAAWNEYTGGAWQQTEAGVGKFILMHIFVSNDPRTGHQVVAIQGENVYGTKSAAREGANTEIGTLVTGVLPMQEFVPDGTVIYQTGSYTNTWKSRIVSTDAGEDYVPWIGSDLSPGTAPSSHPNLTNRDQVNSHPATAVSTDTTAFGGVLSSADDEVQAALDTIDDHAIADHDTTATGTELNTLTGGSVTNLHQHATVPITHASTTGQTADDHHAESHTVVSHSDTSTTGAELTSLADGTRIGPAMHRHEAHICSVRNGSTLQDLSGTNIAVTWNAELHTTKGTAVSFSGTNPTRLTINENGWYQISFNLTGTSGVARAQINAQIRKDGTTIVGPIAGSGYIRYLTYNLESSVSMGAFTLYLTSGTYIEVVCNEVGYPTTWTTVSSVSSFTVHQLMSNA